ncbi:MAG: hypothetical protein U0869_04720 [Chloroflexota bacterium]
MVEELLYLPLLFASLEAVLGRRDVAAVLAALVFASIHVPMNLGPAGGDWTAAAGAVFYQAAVGLIVGDGLHPPPRRFSPSASPTADDA